MRKRKGRKEGKGRNRIPPFFPLYSPGLNCRQLPSSSSSSHGGVSSSFSCQLRVGCWQTEDRGFKCKKKKKVGRWRRMLKRIEGGWKCSPAPKGWSRAISGNERRRWKKLKKGCGQRSFFFNVEMHFAFQDLNGFIIGKKNKGPTWVGNPLIYPSSTSPALPYTPARCCSSPCAW